jgi:hypothetical protein
MRAPGSRRARPGAGYAVEHVIQDRGDDNEAENGGETQLEGDLVHDLRSSAVITAGEGERTNAVFWRPGQWTRPRDHP